jgi:hypothetical protein
MKTSRVHCYEIESFYIGRAIARRQAKKSGLTRSSRRPAISSDNLAYLKSRISRVLRLLPGRLHLIAGRQGDAGARRAAVLLRGDQVIH